MELCIAHACRNKFQCSVLPLWVIPGCCDAFTRHMDPTQFHTILVIKDEHRAGFPDIVRKQPLSFRQILYGYPANPICDSRWIETSWSIGAKVCAGKRNDVVRQHRRSKHESVRGSRHDFPPAYVFCNHHKTTAPSCQKSL